MSEFLVYGIPGSPYLRSALLVLVEKGADWSLVPLAFGEQKSEAHLARHAFGKMPVLTRGDFVLYEAQAIMRFLDRELPGVSLTPKDSIAQARMDQVMSITDWYLAPDVTREISFPRLIAPLVGIPVDDDKVRSALPRAAVCLTELSRLLGDKAYMTGSEISLADLHLAPQLLMAHAVPDAQPLFEAVPNLVDWCRRMAERDSVAATEVNRLVDNTHA